MLNAYLSASASPSSMAVSTFAHFVGQKVNEADNRTHCNECDADRNEHSKPKCPVECKVSDENSGMRGKIARVRHVEERWKTVNIDQLVACRSNRWDGRVLKRD